jgi:glyoxylase-like metal-dependent hydrolase (beta-lactamase superfamily II)
MLGLASATTWRVHVETFAVGPLGCNCSIVADLEAKRAIVIDPGGSYDQIHARLQALGVGVDAIVHTHTHFDHVGSTAELQRATGSVASIHAADRALYELLPLQAEIFRMRAPVAADMDDGLVDGRAIRAGALELGVLHTPGHTPGSCSFVVRSDGKTHLFAGDTLFRGSVGRTDLWGGDSDAIIQSIRSKLLTLPDDTHVVTGHGSSTTIADERARNPFLRGSVRITS